MSKLKDLLPSQKGGLCIFLDEHRSNYQSVEEYSLEIGDRWINEESRKKAIELDTVWELIWYPQTPIGSFRLAAHDFEAIIAYYTDNKHQFE